MALNSSGPISLGPGVAGGSVNTEMFRPSSASLSLNDIAVRTLGKKYTPGSPVSFSDFYGQPRAYNVYYNSTNPVGNAGNIAYANTMIPGSNNSFHIFGQGNHSKVVDIGNYDQSDYLFSQVYMTDPPNSIQILSASNIVNNKVACIVYLTFSNGNLGEGVMLYDVETRSILWVKSLGTTVPFNGYGFYGYSGVARLTTIGNIIVAANISESISEGTSTKILVSKITNSGQVAWKRIIGNDFQLVTSTTGIGGISVTDLDVDDSENIYITAYRPAKIYSCGWSCSWSDAYPKFCFIKLSGAGDTLSNKLLGNTGVYLDAGDSETNLSKCKVVNDNGNTYIYVLIGRPGINVVVDLDLLKLDNIGNLIWCRRIKATPVSTGSTGNYANAQIGIYFQGNPISVDSDGFVYLFFGDTRIFPSGTFPAPYNVWPTFRNIVAKFNGSNGSLVNAIDLGPGRTYGVYQFQNKIITCYGQLYNPPNSSLNYLAPHFFVLDKNLIPTNTSWNFLENTIKLSSYPISPTTETTSLPSMTSYSVANIPYSTAYITNNTAYTGPINPDVYLKKVPLNVGSHP